MGFTACAVRVQSTEYRVQIKMWRVFSIQYSYLTSFKRLLLCNFRDSNLAEVHGEFEVIASSGEVRRTGVRHAVGILDIEIGVDVLPSDEVEYFELNGPLFDMLGGRRPHELGSLGIEDISGTDVDTFVGRHSAFVVASSGVIDLSVGELHP